MKLNVVVSVLRLKCKRFPAEMCKDKNEALYKEPVHVVLSVRQWML